MKHSRRNLEASIKVIEDSAHEPEDEEVDVEHEAEGLAEDGDERDGDSSEDSDDLQEKHHATVHTPFATKKRRADDVLTIFSD
ncbi:hypothetical protein PAXRUDRAFT_16780 [Paxillus rubicundulus Ve08.2h10]|uniref:Uncharacterized protein n=1 Tax=Paxillus rubicundulus Ve08.2h10 TaxID=930991 RepID=A0A0D0DD53_9AGAM|nr:hypothetical protein PAXRUDRAFT_16780 [Paxillus rubicundulus Ve08.2h10]